MGSTTSTLRKTGVLINLPKPPLTKTLQQPPLSPAPTWSPSTVYMTGAKVRGLDGKYLYIMCGSTTGTATGTSAASLGPTGTSYTLQADGSCVWHYSGPVTSTGTYPTYSTVVPTTSASVMDGYLAIVELANLNAMGLTKLLQHSDSTPIYKLTNTNLEPGSKSVQRPRNGGSVSAPSRPVSLAKGCARMMTNCNKWIALAPQGPYYAFESGILGITVNGQWLSEDQTMKPASTTIAAGGAVLLDMTKFPAGSKELCVYFIRTTAQTLFRIYVSQDEFVSPSEDVNYKIAIEGDSIAQGSYIGSADTLGLIEQQIEMQLGVKDIYNNCIGATGAVNIPARAARTTYIERLPDIVNFRPDALIIWGAHNDGTGGAPPNDITAVSRRQAFIDYIAAAKAKMPNAVIFVVGAGVLAGESLSGGGSFVLEIEQDWKFATDLFNDSVVFIPVLTAPVLPISTAQGEFFQSTSGAIHSTYTDGHPCPGYYKQMVPYVCSFIRDYFIL